jgi:two-component system, cell cycle sensor histidine kinase and response regulator CckA
LSEIIGTAIERRRTEEALRQSEEQFRDLFRNSLVSILVHDKDTGEIIDANPQAIASYGLSSLEELQASEFWIEPPYSSREALANIRRAASEGPQAFEWLNRRASGELFWEQVYLVAGVIGGVRRVMATCIDITDRKKAEQEQNKLRNQLHHAQKMEAIGRLAGGVAHDFNNILTGVKGFASLIAYTLPAGDPIHRDLEEIQNAADRGAALTRQLLAFGRRQMISPQVVNLNELIEESRRMLERVIGEDITISIFLEKTPWNIKVDPIQIDMILVNLAINARDAMPDGGKLTIETKNLITDAKKCQQCAKPIVGPYVLLSVTDTGTGISQETLEHIFEPFFTTKEKGKGTGLGLATVEGAVHQSEGHINVYSEPGIGTIFRIYLPTIEGEVEQRRPVVDMVRLRGDETILLVEDQDQVRRAGRRLLVKHGYRVLAAPNGPAALEIIREYQGKIDLLLTDVVMPGMNGRELYRQAAELIPRLKVLYTSGYTENAIAHHGVLEDGVDFVAKPFSPAELMEKVKEILERSDG